MRLARVAILNGGSDALMKVSVRSRRQAADDLAHKAAAPASANRAVAVDTRVRLTLKSERGAHWGAHSQAARNYFDCSPLPAAMTRRSTTCFSVAVHVRLGREHFDKILGTLLYRNDQPGFGPHQDALLGFYEPLRWPTHLLVLRPSGLVESVRVQDGVVVLDLAAGELDFFKYDTGRGFEGYR